MAATEKASLSLRSARSDKEASQQQNHITFITDFFQERYGSQSLRITMRFLLTLPAGLNTPPELALKWEVVL